MQTDFVIELFERAKQEGIHTCIDTSGITYNPDNTSYIEKLDRLMEATDLIMLDIKHINPEEHIKLTGVSNKRILDFTAYLEKKQIPVWIRHVIVPTITDETKYLDQLGWFIGGLKNLKALDILPYHSMGKLKYKQLGMEYPLEAVPDMDKNKIGDLKAVIIEGIRRRRRELKPQAN